MCSVEDLNDARTVTLADFFSILLERSRVTGPMPGCPFVRECHGGISFAKYFRNSVHQFGDLLDILRGKILPKSRMQPPPSFHFFSGDGRHHAHQLNFGFLSDLGGRVSGWGMVMRTVRGRHRDMLHRPERPEGNLRPRWL